MNPVRITISPELLSSAGSAVHWLWRQIFTALGWPWAEASATAPVDVAYVVSPEQAPAARLVILASPDRWANPSHARLADVSVQDAPFVIRYVDDAGPLPSVEQRGATCIVPRDILFDCYWLLTGQEERTWSQDGHGFHDLAGTSWESTRLLELAPVAEIVGWLRQRLEQLDLGPTRPLWPNGKRAAIAITHDVDYPEVVRWLEPARIVARQRAAGLGPAWRVLTGKQDHWRFPQWMAFESSLGARSAFYFVARQGSLMEYARGTPDPFYDVTAPRFRDLFRTLIDGGWEVGMHASYRAYESADRFGAEKATLEAASGAPVLGNRHHYWHMNPADVEETLQMHGAIGLLYDTSLTHDRYLGWRRGTNIPFFPFAQRTAQEIGVVQLPVAWMDAQLMQRTDLSQAEREALVCKLIERTAAHGGLFVANVHDYVFDDSLYPGWLATLRAGLEHVVARGDFWIAAPATIARHWVDRYRTLREASTGLTLGLPDPLQR